MGSPSAIISLGYGAWASVSEVLTLGYGIGEASAATAHLATGTWEIPSHTGTWEIPSHTGTWEIL